MKITWEICKTDFGKYLPKTFLYYPLERDWIQNSSWESFLCISRLSLREKIIFILQNRIPTYWEILSFSRWKFSLQSKNLSLLNIADFTTSPCSCPLEFVLLKSQCFISTRKKKKKWETYTTYAKKRKLRKWFF